jgi:hypothetical protein
MMKREPNSRKNRGRGNGGGNSGRRNNGGNRPKSVESGGPNTKIRGNVSQVLEKYLSLARDAASSSDRIAAENYYQHAEHYYRVLHAADDRREAPSPGKSGNGQVAAEAEAASPTPPTAGEA